MPCNPTRCHPARNPVHHAGSSQQQLRDAALSANTALSGAQPPVRSGALSVPPPPAPGTAAAPPAAAAAAAAERQPLLIHAVARAKGGRPYMEDRHVWQHGQSDPLAVPQLGPCASSGRAWRLWAAQHSQEEASLLGAQPLPRVLEPSASEDADSATFDHSGVGTGPRHPGVAAAGCVVRLRARRARWQPRSPNPKPNPNPNPDPNPNPNPNPDPNPDPNPNPNQAAAEPRTSPPPSCTGAWRRTRA